MTVEALVYVAGMVLKMKTVLSKIQRSKNLHVFFNCNIFTNFFSDSDDSDTEGGLGNVERVVMRPPGHSGKAKRGHLCFDSSFETGKN